MSSGQKVDKINAVKWTMLQSFDSVIFSDGSVRLWWEDMLRPYACHTREEMKGEKDGIESGAPPPSLPQASSIIPAALWLCRPYFDKWLST